jgi:hypothetical protein
VFLSALVLALTLPAETLLVRALQEPSTDAAVRDWVGGLEARQLAAAADRIQDYPFVYRREIMRALSPDRRAEVWQVHIARYVRDNPGLDADALAVLKAAQSVPTPEFMAGPTDEQRKAAHAVADQVVAVLGRETAVHLLHRLGPPDGMFASIEPLTLKLTNLVRSGVLSAAIGQCDCSVGFGCLNMASECSSEVSCDVIDTWPACGWWFADTCDGVCVSGW